MFNIKYFKDKKTIWILLITLALSVSIAIALPFKQNNTMTWDSVTTNVDGSPITDLGGYKVYWKTGTNQYSDINSKPVGKVTSINIQTTIGDLKGNYCFVVTAYDISGNESDFSNEACADFIVKKNKPSNLKLQ